MAEQVETLIMIEEELKDMSLKFFTIDLPAYILLSQVVQRQIRHR